jgi:hypothetical protein
MPTIETIVTRTKETNKLFPHFPKVGKYEAGDYWWWGGGP